MTARPERLSSALAGRYRLERELGAGGMATVYLAEDLKHDRKVAIKVLKPELAAVLGADRFVVEIKTTASLQHPHILPLFDSGTADGFLFYVMPYIQGETIREKLNRETQFGVDEAVRIAREVADALDYAHRHGVIHRDIKPENLLLHDGRAMVMDFGIALAVSAAAGGRMTETGLSLGTPHYMSPEQATAEKEITGRSDVYSLASVLYEMLAGQPPHLGGSAQQIIMKIIAEPVAAVTTLRKSVPPNVAGAVAKALEKIPADRFNSAAEFAAALGDRQFTSATATVSASSTKSWLSDTRSRVALGVIAALVVLAVMAPRFGSGAEDLAVDPPPMLVRLPLTPGDTLVGARSNGDRPSRTVLAISPDGSTLAYVSRRNGVRQLFLRPLSGETATPIAGTEGAESPFFSPTGQQLGFWSGGRLKQVPLTGGTATEIAAVPRISGASWSDDGRIAVGTGLAGIIILSATGATPPDTVLGPGASLPHFLPGGEALLFSQRTLGLGFADIRIEVLTIKSGARKILVQDGADARYAPTGHLVFGRLGTLLAVPFDVASLSVAGSPVVLLSDVMQSLNGGNAVDITAEMQVAISPLGHLVYLTGGVTPDRARPLAWLDRQGRATPIPAAGTRPFFAVRLSADDRRAVATTMGKVAGVHVIDFDRGSVQTLDVRDFQLWPLWSLDGSRVVHHGTLRDSVSLMWSLADGSRPPAPFADKVIKGDPAFWSPDSTKLYTTPPLEGTGCLYEVNLSDGNKTPVQELPEGCNDPALSPNGRWIAYSAQEQGSGRREVFVQPWPALDWKRNVSVTGGQFPVWTRDGRELVFSVLLPADSAGERPQRVMSVQVGGGQDFTFGPPRELFTSVFEYSTPLRAFDVTKDGSRFLVSIARRVSAPAGEPRMIVNWFTELKRLSVRSVAR